MVCGIMGNIFKMLFGVLRGFLGVILGRKGQFSWIFTYLETSKTHRKAKFFKKKFFSDVLSIDKTHFEKVHRGVTGGS